MNETDRADGLLFQLLEAGRAQVARLEGALKAVGLSGAKYEVLSQLVKAGEPVPLRLLADGQRCVPSNMTTLIDRLEADGLVRRVDDPADRRSRRAELTELGRERAAAGAAAVAAVQVAFADALSDDQRSALARALATLDQE